MNFFNGFVDIKENKIIVGNQNINLNSNIVNALKNYDNKELCFGLRAEDLIINENGAIEAEVTMIELLGKDSIIHAKFENYDLAIYCEEGYDLSVNDKIKFNIDLERLHIFDEFENTIKF